ncbi:amidohydrolase family protein [Flaviflexus massiliensis]|uniref:amidohydrolase family protein n=1 Tax=Flaviflexus massiliensis TaxID=1522309 RepID=UPI0006D52BB2|nr:amidohydrolase family protein [Flaviflexus massiliensis]
MIHLTGPILTGTEVHPEAWVVDGTITYQKPDGQPSRTISGTVLPGLVDVHCHIGLGSDVFVEREDALNQAKAVLDSGVTLVRDLGTPGDMTWIDSEVNVPRIIHCGRHIARPKRYLRGIAREIEPNELPEVVAEEAQRSNGWVKLVGDWIDRSGGADSDLTPLWPRDVLIDAVVAAHENGAKVAVHTFATETIDDLLAANVDDIEHGTGMTPDQMKEVAKRGVYVTPTANQVETFIDIANQAGTKYPVYGARMRDMYENRREHQAAMADAGVSFLMGSDAGSTLGFGTLPSELLTCIDAGIPASTVIAAASWEGRQKLGFDALSEGGAADLVVYDDDPRSNPQVLLNPVAVLLDGQPRE